MSKILIVYPLKFFDINFTILVIVFLVYCTCLSTYYIRLTTFTILAWFSLTISSFVVISLLLTEVTQVVI